MIINKKYFTKRELKNSEEAIILARKIMAGESENSTLKYDALRKKIREMDLDKESNHYIYLVGERVSDLIIATHCPINGNFAFRKCTQEEWLDYYHKYVM
jgi:hypothetical protein